MNKTDIKIYALDINSQDNKKILVNKNVNINIGEQKRLNRFIDLCEYIFKTKKIYVHHKFKSKQLHIKNILYICYLFKLIKCCF